MTTLLWVIQLDHHSNASAESFIAKLGKHYTEYRYMYMYYYVDRAI